MAIKRRYTRYKKRPYKKRYVRRKNYRRMRNNFAITKELGAADRYFVKMRYTDVISPTITLTAVTYSYNQYILNSIVQPNYVGVTNNLQIPYLSTYSSVYARFRVHAVKLTAEAVNNNATNAVYLQTHLQDDESPPGFSNWTQLRNWEGNRYTKVSLLSPVSGMNRSKHTIYVKLNEFNGNKKSYDADIAYSGFCSTIGTIANPGRLFYAFVTILNQNNTTVTLTIPVNVHLTYWVEFYDRIDQNS